MEKYTAKVTESTRVLTAVEKVRIRTALDTMESINDNLKGVKDFAIPNIDYLATVEVHNPNVTEGGNVDYTVYVIATTDGKYYRTSSDSFAASAADIISDMQEVNEPWQLIAYKLPSKKNQGDFLTATVG